MAGEAILFLIAVFVAAILLFAMVFFIIMFSDLECDFINPIDLCNKLNQFVLPEYALHAALALLFLFTLRLTPFFLNVPLVIYHAYSFSKKRHLYDATEIFRTLPVHKRESFVKLGFYMVSFFYYLYRMILGLL